MESPKTFVIIGNGIAAWRVNEVLESKFVDARIIRIGKEDFAPKCSFRTTSINCLRGTEKGISPLGDVIVDAHREFLAFYESSKGEVGGVEKSVEHQLWDPQDSRADEKWSKRYPDYEVVSEVEGLALQAPMKRASSEAYLIDPQAFYRWQSKRLPRTDLLDDYVVSVEKKNEGGHLIKLHGGDEIKADKVFICAGYLSSSFKKLATKPNAADYLRRCKPVRGSYMACRPETPINKSFSLAIGGFHLIFRKSDQRILLGSTSENDCSIQLPMKKEIDAIYEKIQRTFVDSSFLPVAGDWNLINGVRHKGPKRMPYWGELGDDCYGVFGLYKNAFSFSFLAARDLAEILKSDKT